LYYAEKDKPTMGSSNWLKQVSACYAAKDEKNIPFYLFKCERNHTQELRLSFAEHADLAYEPGIGTYVECRVKYGDLKQPMCGRRAYQVFDGNVGLINFDT